MPRRPEPGFAAEETAIRCRDLAAMTAFYRDVVGLEIAGDDEPDAAVRLRPGEGFAAVAPGVALFAAEDEDEPAPHHLTLTVADAAALERAGAWFRAHGLAPESAEHAWAGWKCLSVTDPEGNTVELAAPVRQRTIPSDAASDAASDAPSEAASGGR